MNQKLLLISALAFAISACKSEKKVGELENTPTTTVPAGGQGRGTTTSTTIPALSIRDISLDRIPSFVSMIKSQTQASSLAPSLSVLTENDGLGSLSSNANSRIKDVFFKKADGSNLLLDILSTNPGMGSYVTSSDRDSFFGKSGSENGGYGSCKIAQNIAEQYERMLESQNTSCLIKKLSSSSLNSGITRDAGTTELSSLFKKVESDRWIKINISKSSLPTKNVYIKISGNSTTNTQYIASLYSCESGVHKKTEEYQVQYISNSLIFNSEFNQESLSSEEGKIRIDNFISVLSNSFAFDSSQSLSFENYYRGSWGKLKGYIQDSGTSEIVLKNWKTDGSNATKSWSKSQYTASNLFDLKLLNNGYRQKENIGGNASMFSGYSSYSDRYESISSNSYLLSLENDALSFGPSGSSEDDFFSGGDFALSFPTTSFDNSFCNINPSLVNDELSIDLDSADTSSIRSSCDNERILAYEICDISDIQTAYSKVFQSFGH